MDARKYLKTGNFLKKQDLRQDGPRQLVIAEVEDQPTYDAKHGGSDESEVHLVFTDGSRLSLRTAENLRRMIRFFGHEMENWVGKTIEAYFSPDIPNPKGDPGGIRLQLPTSEKASAPYVSDLDDDQPAVPRAKPNGAEQPDDDPPL